ncbi:hypothetical protein ACFL96_01785 [Thermoproteota archaeon]
MSYKVIAQEAEYQVLAPEHIEQKIWELNLAAQDLLSQIEAGKVDALKNCLSYGKTMKAGLDAMLELVFLKGITVEMRQEVLRDSAFRKVLCQDLSTMEAVCLMMALMCGSYKFKLDTDCFTRALLASGGTADFPFDTKLNSFDAILYAAYLAGKIDGDTAFEYAKIGASFYEKDSERMSEADVIRLFNTTTIRFFDFLSDEIFDIINGNLNSLKVDAMGKEPVLVFEVNKLDERAEAYELPVKELRGNEAYIIFNVALIYRGKVFRLFRACENDESCVRRMSFMTYKERLITSPVNMIFLTHLPW